MANQPESAVYDAGVFQLETTTPVLGGVGGAANSPLLSLANRTAYLKAHIDALEAAAAGFAPLNSPALTGTPTTTDVALADRSARIANTKFVQDTVYSVVGVNCAGDANVVLSAVQAGGGILNLTGLLTGNINVVVPNTAKFWIVVNGTTGAFTVTVKTAAGTGVAVTQGVAAILYCDATNVRAATLDTLNLALLGVSTAPTAAAGTNTTQVANTAFSRQLKAGLVQVNVAGNSNVILSQPQWGVGLIVLTGVLTGNISVFVPAASDQWVFSNQTTGDYSVTINTQVGSGVEVEQDQSQHLFCDGTNVRMITGAFDASYAPVRQPVLLSPAPAEVLLGQTPFLQGGNYYSLYGVAQGGAQFQVALASSFLVNAYDSGTLGAVTGAQVPSGSLAANTSYYARLRYQDAEGTWSPWSTGVQFQTGGQIVATPSITSPANGTTNVGDGVTLTSSAFSMTTGVDTHLQSDWEIWTGAAGTGTRIWNSTNDATNKTTIAVAAGTFSPSTTYYPRVRHAGINSGYSGWSAAVSFATASSFGEPAIGAAYGGGYFAGYIVISGQKYALIVAPKSSDKNDEDGSYTNYVPAGATSVNDGAANTAAMMAHSQTLYPAARYCDQLIVGGYSDWYLPSRDELEVLYRNLKPTTDNNQTGARSDGTNHGVNANSFPVGVAYTGGSPARTGAAIFQSGGEQALQDRYWSSTLTSGANPWRQVFTADSGCGAQTIGSRSSDSRVRAVRKVLAV